MDDLGLPLLWETTISAVGHAISGSDHAIAGHRCLAATKDGRRQVLRALHFHVASGCRNVMKCVHNMTYNTNTIWYDRYNICYIIIYIYIYIHIYIYIQHATVSLCLCLCFFVVSLSMLYLLLLTCCLSEALPRRRWSLTRGYHYRGMRSHVIVKMPPRWTKTEYDMIMIRRIDDEYYMINIWNINIQHDIETVR